MEKTAWAVGTKFNYTSTTGQLWPGMVIETDGDWRRIRWTDNDRTNWVTSNRLDNQAKKVTQARTRASKPPRVKKEVSNEPQ